MRKQSLFSKERMVYWSDEFADVVNLLTGRDALGNSTHSPICALNADVIVLAAVIGVKQKRKRDFGAGVRKEISTATIASRGLEPYIFLVGLLAESMSNVEILRPENEEVLIREFEQYAAGGLEYLRGDFSSSPTTPPELIVEKLISDTHQESIAGAIPTLI
jgi:dnd system-associated protein 4